MVHAREVSSRELTRLFLDRIDALDGELNSCVLVLGERALELAAAKDDATANGDELPPFHGVPATVKDLHFLEGVRVTFGTSSMRDFVAPFDEEVVRQMKLAGMVPIAKTNVPELGTVPYTESHLLGPCRNPWDPDRTPGGSSGGAAAALAAGLCAVAQGSDGAGSIRIPAACTGLFGLKPSRDRISNGPLFGDLALGLATTGFVTRTVGDSAALLDVAAGYAPGDPGIAPPPERPFAEEVGRDPGRCRIGVTTSVIHDARPEAKRAVDDARALLEQLGHETFDVDLGIGDEQLGQFRLLWGSAVAATPLPTETLEPFNRWLASLVADTGVGPFLQAIAGLQFFARTVSARWGGQLDLLLTPTLGELPLPVGECAGLGPEETFDRITRFASFTPMFNVTGQPAASLPLHHDDDSGLPVAVQLVGQLAGEAELLRVCAQLERARPWADRRPPGSGQVSSPRRS